MIRNAYHNLNRFLIVAIASTILGGVASPANAAIIFSDLFTQTADTTLASHTPTNAGLSWTILIQNGGGTMRADASSDNLQDNSGGANDGVMYRANVTGGYQNVDYEASVVQVNGDTGGAKSWITVRAQDANNMYTFRFNETAGQLYERVGGVYAALGAATPAVTDGSVVTLRIIGDTITVLDDGVVIRTLTDASHTAAGTAGLGMGDVGQTTGDDLDAQVLDTFSVTTYVRITGTVYSDEGTTAVGAGVNVSVSVNGAAPVLTDATDASGVYDIRGLTAAAGDVLTIYVNDNTAGNEAAVVTVANGNDMSGINLYYNYLKVRQDNAGSLTAANLNTADNSGDSDITGLYTFPGGVFTMAASKELFIDSGHTFAPGASFVAGTIDDNGTLTMAGNTATVAGDWDATGGTFTFTTGSVIFNGGATTQNVTSNGNSFNGVEIGTASAGAVVSTSDNMDINGALSVRNGGATTFDIANDTVNAAGNVNLTNLDTFTVTSATFIFDGTTILTSASRAFNAVQIGGAATGGSLATTDNMDINGALTVTNNGATTFDVTGDTINAAGSVTLTNLDTFTVTNSTFIFDGTTTLTSVAGLPFNTVQIGSASAGGSLTTANNMDINGALTVTNNGATTFDISNDTINAAANVTLTNLDTFTVTSATFIFDGTTSLTSAGLAFNAVQIGSASAGASVTAADNMDINGALTVNNGGATTWTITNRTINAAGDVTLTNLDTFNNTGAIFIFDGTTALTSAGFGFNAIQIGSASAAGSLSTSGNLDLNGALTVNNGGATSFDFADDTIFASSDITFTNLDAVTHTNSTFVFDGTTTFTTSAADTHLNHVQIGGAATGGSLTTASSMEIIGNLTVTNNGATTLNVSDDTIVPHGNVNLTNLDTFTNTNSTFLFIGTNTLTSAGWAFNNITVGSASVGDVLTTADNLDINGALTVLNGGATTLDISNDTVNAASTVNLTNLDTFTVASATFIFDGTTTLTSAGRAFNTVQIGTGAVGASVTTADNMDINGALTVLNGGATTFDVTNDVVNAASTVNLTNLDTFTTVDSTFIFDGTTTLTSGGRSFESVQIGTSGIGASVTTADNTTLTGSLKVLNGGATTFNIDSDTVTTSGTIDLTNLDTFTVTNSTFVFNGTTPLTSAGLAFNHFQIGTGSAGATVTTNDNLDINGNLTVLNGGATTFDISNDTVNAASTVNLTNLDTFTVASATFIFDGTTTLTSAGRAFNAVQIGTGAVGASVTTADNMDINGALTVLNGGATTLDITNDVINASSTINLTNLDTFTTVDSTFIFDGTTTLTSGGRSFESVQIGTSGIGASVTTADNMTLTGSLKVLNGGATTFNIDSDTITTSGTIDLTNLDTFTVTNSTFAFNGTTPLTSAGLAFNHFQIGTGGAGATVTANDNLDINGNVTVLNGGATTWTITSRTINAAGNVTLTNLDTFNNTGAIFIFDGTTALTSASFGFNAIQIGSASAAGSLSTSDNLDLNGALTVNNGGATAIDFSDDTIFISNNITLTNLDGFTSTNSTAIFDGTTTLTNSGDSHWNNVQIGGAASGGSLTAVNLFELNGNLTATNNGATSLDISNITMSVNGNVNLTNLDAFTVTNSTFNFLVTNTLTSAGWAFNHVQIGGPFAGDTLTTADNMDINGVVTVFNGGPTTWNITNDVVNAASTVNLTNLDTLTTVDSTFVFDGTTTLTSGGRSFESVQIGTAAIGASVTTADSMGVTGTLIVRNGGATTLNIDSDTLTMGGTMNLTFLDTFTVTSATVAFNGITPLTTAGLAFNNVQIGTASAGATVTTNDNWDINGNVTVQNGGVTTIDITGDTVNASANVTFTNLDVFTATNSTFIFDGTTTFTSEPDQSFNDVQIGGAATGGSVTTANNMEISGALTVTNNGATTFNISDDTISVSSIVNLTNLDTFTVTNSTFLFRGTNVVTSAGWAFNNIQIGSGGGGASVTSNDNMDINGNLTVTNGGATTFNITNDVVNAASTVNLTNLDTFTTVDSTFIFDGTSTVTTGAATNIFESVQIGTSGIGASVTTADGMNISGTLIVRNGGATTFNVDSDTITVGGTVNLTNLDTFTVTNSTFAFNGTTPLTSAGLAFNHFQIGTAGAGATITANDNVDINGNLTVQNGGATSFTVSSRTVNTAGNVTLTNIDTFTTVSSTFIFDGTTTLTSAGQNLQGVQLGSGSAGGTLTTADNMSIDGTFRVLNGGATTFDVSNDTVTFSGPSFSMANLDTFTSASSTFTFDTASGTVPITSNAKSFNAVIFNDGGGGTTWRIVDAMDANSTFTLTNGTFDLNTNDPTLNVGGNFTIASAGTFTVGTNTVTFDGNLTFNDVDQTTLMGSLVVDPTTTLNSDLSCTNLTINASDTLVTAGYEITCSGNITINGTLNAAPGVDGNSTVSLGRTWDNNNLFISTSSTVIFTGTGSRSISSDGDAFNNLHITGAATWDLTDNLDVNGTLRLAAGTLDVTASNRQINVARDWVNAGGTFTQRSGTVVFDGVTQQNVTVGTQNFANISITGVANIVNFVDDWSAVNLTDNAASTDLIFNAGDTYTITGSLRLNGQAALTRIDLNSDDNATRFTLDVTATSQSVSFVRVSNSQASSHDINAVSSSRGNNTDAFEASPHWNFGNEVFTYTWTGSANGTTWANQGNWDAGDGTPGNDGYPDDASDKVIISSTANTITTVGAITIGDLRMVSSYTGRLNLPVGSTFTVEGTGILLSAGTLRTGGALDINGTLNVTGTLDLDTNDSNMNLSGSLRIEAAGIYLAGAGTTTFDGNLTFNDVDGLTNMGTLVIDPTTTMGSDMTCVNLTINASDTLVTAGYEIDCSGAITINGTLNAANGVDGNSTIQVGRAWTNNNLFISTNSTVIFDSSSGSRAVTSGASAYNNVIFNGASTWTLQDNMDVNGNLTLTAGTVDATTSNRRINLAGNWTNNGGSFTERSGTVIFDGTSTVTSNGDNFFNLQIGTASAGGSVTTADNLSVDGTLRMLNGGATTFNITNDVVTMTGGILDLTNLDTFTTVDSTFIFDGTTTMTSAGRSFESLQIGTAALGASVTTADNMTYTGTLLVRNGAATTVNITNDVVTASGTMDFTNLDTFTTVDSTVIFFNGTVLLTSAGKSFESIQIGAETGGPTATTTVTTQDNLTYTGTLLVRNGAVTILNITNDVVTTSGTLDFSNLDTFTTVDSTVIFNGTNPVTSGTVSFESVQVGTASAGATVTTIGNMSVSGTLLVLNGGATTFDITNDTVTVGGTLSWANLDTFTVVDSTVIFNGTTPLTSGGKIFESVQLGTSTAGATVTTQDNMTYTGTLLVRNGGATTFNITNDVVTTAGTVDLTNLDTFTTVDSTVIFNGTSPVTSGTVSFESIQIATASAGASVTTIGNMVVTGTIQVLNGGATSLDITNDTVTVGGTLSWANLDTFTVLDSTVIFNGTTPLTSGGKVFESVQLGTASAGSTVTLIDNMTLSGSLKVLNGGATTFTITNHILTTAGTINFTNLDTFTSITSTVIFNGTTPLTSAGKAFDDFQIGTATAGATVTLQDTLDVDGTLTVQNGGATTFTIAPQAASFAGNVNFTNLDAFNAALTLVTFDGTTTLTSSGKSFGGVLLGTNGGDATLITADNMDIDFGFFGVTGGTKIWDVSNDTIFAAGNVFLASVDSFVTTDSTFVFDGGSTVTSIGASFESVQIGSATAGGVMTTADNMIVTGTLKVMNGGGTTIDMSNDTLTASGTFDLTNLDFFTTVDSTVIFNGGATTQLLTSNSKSFESIQIGTATAGALLTTQDNLTYTGTLLVRNGGATIFNITNDVVTTAGTMDFTNLDTFTVVDSTVIFNGTTPLTSASKTFESLQIGTASAGSTVTTLDNLTLTGSLKVLNGGATTFNITNDVVTTAGTVDLTNLDTFTTVDSTVIFNGTSPVTSGILSFESIQIGTASAGATVTTIGNMVVTGTIQVLNGGATSLDITNDTVTVGGTLSWANLDTFTVLDSTVIFNGTTPLTNGGKVFESVQLGTAIAGATVTTQDNMTLTGSLKVLNGGATTFDITNDVMTTAGTIDFTNLDTFTVVDSTVIFNGTSPLTSAGKSFMSIQLGSASAGGIVTTNDALSIDGTLRALNGGATTLDLTGDTLTFSGLVFNLTNLDTFTSASSSAVFDTSSGTVLVTSFGKSFNNMQFNDAGGGATWRIVDAMDANGTFTLTSGTFDMDTNDPTLNAAGNFTIASAGTFTVGINTVTFDGNLTFNDVDQTTLMGSLVVDPTTTLGSDMTCTNLTINASDTLVTNGYEITCSGNITINGTLNAGPGTDGNSTITLGRTWTNNNLFIGTSSTVIFNGTGNRSITSGGDSFNNLRINGGGTWDLQDNLDVDGTLRLITGTLDVTTNNRQINVARDWVNTGGTFTQRSGTVIFDGAAFEQDVTAGTQNFSRLQVTNTGTVNFLDDWSAAHLKDVVPNSTLIFNAGDTYTISGTLTLNGQAVGTRIILNSDDNATRFAFSVSTAQNVSYVNVRNSEISGTSNVSAAFSIDLNTDKNEAAPHWIFVGNVKRGAVMVVE